MSLDRKTPWAPLYRIDRSGLPELQVDGIVYVWAEAKSLFANAGYSLLKVGEVNAPLWTRSLLKPFQLMALYPQLKQAYPQLESRHFALMTASQNGDAAQRELLEEILQIAQLDVAALQCPTCRPMSSTQTAGEPSPLNHPCAGKHLAHLLFQKSLGLPLNDYLQPEMPAYQQLQELLGYLLNRPITAHTFDGCGMPNFALSALEIAQLYQALAAPMSQDVINQAPIELEPALAAWEEIAGLFAMHPVLIGGQKRLDTALMSEFLDASIPVIAKEGADGLLAVGLGPQSQMPVFQDGLGLLIKLASGYEPDKLRFLVTHILQGLGFALRVPPNQSTSRVLETHFYFEVKPGASLHVS